MNNRSEFQRMMEDCVNGKIELVLTKSISRFGRDTVDGLSAIRELKAHGVEVYFDLEELHSFQPDFELQYSIRAAIAQGEREDFHDSIVLAMHQKVTDGTLSMWPKYKQTNKTIQNRLLHWLGSLFSTTPYLNHFPAVNDHGLLAKIKK